MPRSNATDPSCSLASSASLPRATLRWPPILLLPLPAMPRDASPATAHHHQARHGFLSSPRSEQPPFCQRRRRRPSLRLLHRGRRAWLCPKEATLNDLHQQLDEPAGLSTAPRLSEVSLAAFGPSLRWHQLTSHSEQTPTRLSAAPRLHYLHPSAPTPIPIPTSRLATLPILFHPPPTLLLSLRDRKQQRKACLASWLASRRKYEASAMHCITASRRTTPRG